MPKFEFVLETVNGMQAPMFGIGDELFIPNKTLSAILGVSESVLRSTFSSRREEFDGNCVHNMDAISFLKENKHLFGLKYVRGDMRLWSEDDMITLSMLVRGPRGRSIRRDIRLASKRRAKREVISKEQYETLVSTIHAQGAQIAHLMGELKELKDLRGKEEDLREEWASLSGRALRLRRDDYSSLN